MLLLGNIRAWQKTEAWTRFTRDEQITVMTLWSIARSPLIMGGNMPKNDEFTLSLMTNDEVIAVNQKSANNRQLLALDNNTRFVWVADVPESKGKYMAFFNAAPAPAAGRGRSPAQQPPVPVESTAMQPVIIEITLADIGIAGPCTIRDLWAHKDLGVVNTRISATVPSHGAVLYRIQPQK
jgi:alpha-galactosidase